MAALLVLSAAFTSFASPRLLLQTLEEEKVSFAAPASVSSAPSNPRHTVPLRKRSAQYQAQHRFSSLRGVFPAAQVAIIPDSLRFRTRWLPSLHSQYPKYDPTRLLLAQNAPCFPRAPPFALPLL